METKQQDSIQEMKNVEEISDNFVQNSQIEESKVDYNTFELNELINLFKDLLQKEDLESIKGDVELIKQSFYKKLNAAFESQKKAFVEQGGDLENFVAQKDDSELIFKEIYADYKKKRSAQQELKNKILEDNYSLKVELLEKLKTLIVSSEDIEKILGEFRNLQQEWKNIGQVPPSKTNEVWKEYNYLQEQFYDLMKINKELREYDFKKNLEQKTALCVAAETLKEEEDIISASQKLQKLHDEWKNIGPVEKDLREEIWGRFKEASTLINKKHQAFFDEKKKKEEEYIAQKISICEKVEEINAEKPTTYKLWEEASNRVIELQQDWKKIPFLKKKRVELYDRFRLACDEFFNAKAEFFKEQKTQNAQNLELKKQLCEQAEALKDSKDWVATSNKLVQLQAEWKKVGSVQRRQSDAVWKRFQSACDFFFQEKEKALGDKKKEELENLQLKKELIEKVKNFVLGENREENLTALKDFEQEFNKIGFVAFRQKEKILSEFKAAMNVHYDALHVEAKNRKMSKYKDNLSNKSESALNNERRYLLRQYNELKGEIKTYENNLGFLSSSSKKADKLILEMQRNIEKLKSQLALLEEKINLIDSKE